MQRNVIVGWGLHMPAARGACLLQVVACLLAASGTQADPGPPSLSKLSIHQLAGYTSGAADIIQAHPCVIKVMDIGSPTPLAMVRDYKASTPDGIVVLRQYTPNYYPLSEDPVAAANRFWNEVLLPPLSSLSPADRALIDYVEGPNEADNTPTWGGAQYTNWYNTFWMTLAPLIAGAGHKPCAYSIGVGNPPGDFPTIHDTLDRIVPSLRLIKSLGGAWSYHAYTIPYTTDYEQEKWFSLRHRFYYDYFAAQYPDLADMPLIMTEGGVDAQPGPNGPGWKGGGDAAKFINWLAWFDQQIRQDDYILGVTLFQSGDPNWPSFEVEPIAAWLASHLRAHAPGLPFAPADFDADGDVDQSDFGWFQTCFTGSGIFIVNPPCKAADFNDDNDVDQSDFSIFQSCHSGADLPADPECAN